MTVYELNVGMTCDGCTGAIKRILGKVDSIKEVDCDIANRKIVRDDNLPLLEWITRIFIKSKSKPEYFFLTLSF